MNNEELICFNKKRGNAENFIREFKNGFDIQHFPCLKLNANKAYGLIAAFAYNLMRFSSWTLDSKTPRFSKMLHFRMVYLAGQVVKKARSLIIRLNSHLYNEVTVLVTKPKIEVWLWLAVPQNCHRSLTTEYHTNFAMAPNGRSGTRMSKFWT